MRRAFLDHGCSFTSASNNSLRYNYRDVLNIYLVYLTIHFRDEESYFMDLDTYPMKEAAQEGA